MRRCLVLLLMSSKLAAQTPVDLSTANDVRAVYHISEAQRTAAQSTRAKQMFASLALQKADPLAVLNELVPALPIPKGARYSPECSAMRTGVLNELIAVFAIDDADAVAQWLKTKGFTFSNRKTHWQTFSRRRPGAELLYASVYERDINLLLPNAFMTADVMQRTYRKDGCDAFSTGPALELKLNSDYDVKSQ